MERYYDPERPKAYKYVSVNKSLLDKWILPHWWNVAIKAVPLSVPANLVSMLGNLGSWFSFFIMSGILFGPMSVVGRQRPWLFGLAALGLFFYQTLDDLDGIQARRTGSAGPLGEFVDHWFDSFNAFLFPLSGALAFFPVIPPILVVVTMVLCATADWLNISYIQRKGVLEFGYISGEEIITIVYLFYLSIWFLGYDFWIRPIPFLALPPVLIFFLMAPLLFLISSLGFLKMASGYRRLASMLLTVLPACVWTVHFDLKGGGATALCLGSLIVGFMASRFVGDLMRDRLTGLHCPSLYPEYIALDLLLIACLFMPGLPLRTVMLIGYLVLAAVLASLASQFWRTVERVRLVTGTGLFTSAYRSSPIKDTTATVAATSQAASHRS